MDASATLEDIRTRICAALRVPEDDWVAHACRVIEAHLNQRARRKIYDVTTLGGRLRCARELAGMRQRELSRRVSMPQEQISRMERGLMDLPARKVPGICLSLKIKPAWLLGTSENGGPLARNAILRREITPSMLRRRRKYRALEEARAKAAELNRQRSQQKSAVTLTPEQLPYQDDTEQLSTQDPSS